MQASQTALSSTNQNLTNTVEIVILTPCRKIFLGVF